MEFGIHLNHGRKLLGSVGLDHINGGDLAVELWFIIIVAGWGKDPATEPAQAVLRFGFEHRG